MKQRWIYGFLGIYAAVFIYATSFVIEGKRWFMLFDDAMISMRYAWNLFHGNGYVWNIGEHVEGATNALWAFYMTLWQWLPENIVSLPIQITGLVLLLAAVHYVHKIGGTIPAILTATYYPLIYWSLIGMETGVVALVIILSVYLYQQDKDALATSVLAMGFALRPDIIILIPVALILRRKDVIRSLSLAVLIVGSLTLMRYVYFGDVFPNTYYAKMVGTDMLLRWTRGGYYLVKQYPMLLALLALAMFWRDKCSGCQNNKRTLPLLFAVTLLAYNVHIGGDVWDFHTAGNRFVAVAAPMIFLALPDLKFRYRPIAIALVIYVLHAGMLSDALLINKPMYSEENAQKTRLALDLRETEPYSIAVTWAGIIMYLNPDSYGVDILGKCDPYIARLPVIETRDGMKRLIGFNPGHMKWDYTHSIDSLKPHIITSLWNKPERANLTAYKCDTLRGQAIWVRK